jgi:hypothetical protein
MLFVKIISIVFWWLIMTISLSLIFNWVKQFFNIWILLSLREFSDSIKLSLLCVVRLLKRTLHNESMSFGSTFEPIYGVTYFSWYLNDSTLFFTCSGGTTKFMTPLNKQSKKKWNSSLVIVCYSISWPFSKPKIKIMLEIKASNSPPMQSKITAISSKVSILSKCLPFYPLR